MTSTQDKVAATRYRSGQLSSAEADHLAWEILEIYVAEDHRDLHVFLTQQLRELPSSGGTVREILAELSELLALQLNFARPEDPGETKSASELLFLISFSERAPDEADDLESFDFYASSWWRKLSSDLRAYGDEWAAEIANEEALLIENEQFETIERDKAK
jgi:hypothetical protein